MRRVEEKIEKEYSSSLLVDRCIRAALLVMAPLLSRGATFHDVLHAISKLTPQRLARLSLKYGVDIGQSYSEVVLALKNSGDHFPVLFIFDQADGLDSEEEPLMPLPKVMAKQATA